MPIRSFRDNKTEAVFAGRCPKGFQPDVFKVARRKLAILDAAISLDVLRTRRAIGFILLRRIGPGSTPSGSTISSASAFAGQMRGPEDVEITDYH